MAMIKKYFNSFQKIISFDNDIWVRSLDVIKLEPCLTFRILLQNIKYI